ncbi:hypothetical protein O9G_002488 [Rozella allomycis CSF55]|uniref:RNI-like protein n=1 Tax=Rozella allomycis (strain CSF55) TaxID=988480 RepID=A0A075AUT4_ROZAC|nr:hypothetical protein O9G_002488 [Rozella allomycis CSF55]|eukprot:EPZ33925.1 hypothetical protein O9G_002488 [Rozella allomycis CSF55]
MLSLFLLIVEPKIRLLGFNNLSIRGFEILFDGLSATKISSLDLSFSLGPFPWNVLAAKILKLKHLKSLNLSGVVLRQENLKHLCDILSLSNIENISLMGSFNAVPSSVLKRELPAVFKCMKKIKSLNLSYNKLNPEILWSLTKSMKELTNLRVLKLSNTNILDADYFTRRKLLSVGFVFRFIESVKNVEVLDVSGNNLGYEGAKLMLKELKERNKKIRENVVRIENELIFCREINDSELRIAREKRFRKELRELKELEKRFKVLAFYNCNVAFKAPGGIIDELNSDDFLQNVLKTLLKPFV